MFLKQFTLKLIIRIILILINAIAIAFVFPNIIEGQLMFTIVVLIVIIIIQIALLIHFIRRSNKLLATFLLAISNKDYSIKFGNEYAETPYSDLTKAFNKILASYRLISKEGETQHQFIEKLVSNMPVGVIVIEGGEEVNYINNRAQGILNVNNVTKWINLEETSVEFCKQANSIKQSGDFKYETYEKAGKLIYSVIVHEFYLFEKSYRMIVIQDISKDVESGEIDAMHRLIRILTHEIMNSVTPINSLSETIAMLMDNEQGQAKDINEFSEKNVNDIRESVLAIKDRIDGLDHFVNNFRSLTKTNQLSGLELIKVGDLLTGVEKLMEQQCSNAGVKFFLEIGDENIEFKADAKLVEQVIINLLTNSLDALVGVVEPTITVKVYNEDTHTFVQIVDNGKGISEEKLNDIFIPFYTTKQQGSGIGLSLAKQIMRLHNGTIRVSSEPEIETVFTLQF